MNMGAILVVLLFGAVIGLALTAALARRPRRGSRLRRALIASTPAPVLILLAGLVGSVVVMQTASPASMPGILGGVLIGAGIAGGVAALVAGLITAFRLIRD